VLPADQTSGEIGSTPVTARAPGGIGEKSLPAKAVADLSFETDCSGVMQANSIENGVRGQGQIKEKTWDKGAWYIGELHEEGEHR
jgi:hypothetical protein